jgi:hypothetical protein
MNSKFKTEENIRKIRELLKYSQGIECDNSSDINRHRGKFLLVTERFLRLKTQNGLADLLCSKKKKMHY